MNQFPNKDLQSVRSVSESDALWRHETRRGDAKAAAEMRSTQIACVEERRFSCEDEVRAVVKIRRVVNTTAEMEHSFDPNQ